MDEFRDRFFYKTGDHTDDHDRRSPEYVKIFLWNGSTLSDDANADYQFSGYSPLEGILAPAAQYHIMAYLSESRTYPLGASPGIQFGGLSAGDTDLANAAIWPVVKADNTGSVTNPADGPYSTHRWHSGQFRMTMPEQKEYWKALMRVCRYGVSNALP